MEQPNINYIVQLSGDDETFKLKMISILKTELPLETNAYKDKITKKEYTLAAESVHKLKHKISVLGLEKSYYLAEKFENNLKANSTNLQKEFEEILILMQEYVNNL